MIAPVVLAAASLVGSPQAAPGDLVTLGVHTQQRARSLVQVYLVPAAAKGVRSAMDPRLHYIGSARPRNGRVTVSFRIPPLNGRYRAWCAECGFGGRLHVTMPPATSELCPASVGRAQAPEGLNAGTWQGNDSFWTSLFVDGLVARPEDAHADGSIWTKLFWYSRVHGILSLSGRRLDAASPPLIVHRVNEGSQTNWNGATWATPVTFPAPGCWRLTARVAATSFAVSYSFVLKVRVS